jgi:hypothetical protein
VIGPVLFEAVVDFLGAEGLIEGNHEAVGSSELDVEPGGGLVLEHGAVALRCSRHHYFGTIPMFPECRQEMLVVFLGMFVESMEPEESVPVLLGPNDGEILLAIDPIKQRLHIYR